MNRLTAICLILICLPGQSLAGTQASKECPRMADHHDHVNQRGDEAMGFSHQKTVHHFRLYSDGGAIEVEAKESSDTASRDQIRAHLAHIARMFAAGNFDAPMLIHGCVPPGVPMLKRLKGAISYEYQETELGGRIRIITTNPRALKAVHDFLHFQITDHETGDPIAVSSPAP
jgi:hypothetical protein